ncbi:hypothetical protein CRG98_007776 [Punica granatum]|uniref:Uncharacterized protein n=1 Tax=Punica granatum TaxID=22663 RepID=A0A2I0KTM8_PUNGR|nr:hypothetical protein CRG98_007776 [Punica granatum]
MHKQVIYGIDKTIPTSCNPNSSKSRVIYLASGYEERVGEVFESRVTRLNAWKGARVQRKQVRVCTDVGRAGQAEAHAGRTSVRRAGVRAWCARARGARRERAATVHYSPGSTIFTRNEESNLK